MRIESGAPRIAIPNEKGLALPIPEESSQPESFGQFLTQALDDVNNTQAHAGELVQQYATGKRMDVHEVMIGLEKASTAMALTLQVRNKLVEAYQEVMRTNV